MTKILSTTHKKQADKKCVQGGGGSLTPDNPDPMSCSEMVTLGAAARRWGVDRDAWSSRLNRTYEEAEKMGDSRTMARCVQTAIAMESQNQNDEHLLIKNKRLDEGKDTERIGGINPLMGMSKNQLKRISDILDE